MTTQQITKNSVEVHEKIGAHYLTWISSWRFCQAKKTRSRKWQNLVEENLAARRRAAAANRQQENPFLTFQARQGKNLAVVAETRLQERNK
jgi:tRNA A37 methylthiotransferase MiaB